ncbi:MAG: citramalate synthase [Candidatus Brocadia sp. AMX2]|uniref:Citramalate synthase n=1 Tax=Candidatus Brocadia sinica JPN1 TaxID=1197129 RepID=A0ABQ0K093_9BACT|nr:MULTISPECIES: citramalate synthase [Brocadia]MBC6933687.1 citramalate synthase [Candidatus Brocadia sp.]MBL1170478.1 citramalate synthase [Candidatus Brocadia sp. AMX1]MCK6469825.1 citramalate synthase [Candidatus Brocadia sinica]NOG40057.1 citramalate synthase [Planctomycetota bacterium]KAA0243102.1 MAG: citramalate synthase [Candidatus Brocadia sp. AMX2]
MDKIFIYDTTLRDGSQGEGISFSLQDKLAITLKLDDLGVDYIEGGYPMANPKDESYFKEVKSLKLRHAQIASFGSTRRANTRVEDDKNIRALLMADTPVVTIVGKSWDFQVKNVLKVSLDENLKMVSDTIAYLKSKGKVVFFDAEHFFDGYKKNREYSLKVLHESQLSGADAIVLCDTNGGSLPAEIAEIVGDVRENIQGMLSIHVHNDGDLAVANTLAAVGRGVRQVQGTINGIGERCGNADLCSIIPNLVLKMGYHCLEDGGLRKLTEVSRYVYETANLLLRSNQPFVGVSAFAHKGGLHVNAIQKDKGTYEHIPPESVGNERKILISELSGSSTILVKVEKFNLAHDGKLMRTILEEVQNLENEGYQFESAEASFELLVRKKIGRYKTFFDLEGFRVIVEKRENGLPLTEATVKVKVNNIQELSASEGAGPVNALDAALRKALERFYPSLKNMKLVDYKVRVINPRSGTAAKVRVIIESQDKEDIWNTVGVSENLIEASWHALVDSIEYKLLKEQEF